MPAPDTRDRASDATLTAVAAARFDAAQRFPYLATALFALTVVVRPNGGTYSVDRRWRMYVDPLTTTAWTHEDRVTGVLHELWHLLRDHSARADQIERCDLQGWNIAGDAEINDDLADAGLVMLPTDVLPATLSAPLHLAAEQYYARRDDWWSRLDRSGRPDCGSGAGGELRPWEVSDGDLPGISPHEAEEIRAHTAAQVLASQASGRWHRWARSVGRSQVDWRTLLRRCVRHAEANASGAVDYRYSRPSRRTASLQGVVLPSMAAPRPSVAVVVDTSGSVDDELLGASLAEIDGIVSARGHRSTPVICCDSAASAPQRVASARSLTMRGGGSTDMRIGMAAALRVRPRPHAVIVVTDGHTPWPDRPPDGVRVIVCLLPSHVTPMPPPEWASVVRVVA